MNRTKRTPSKGTVAQEKESEADEGGVSDESVKELVAANNAFNEENESLRKELAEAKSSLAKRNPVTRNKYLETEGLQIGQDALVESKDGMLVKATQDLLDDPNFIKKAEIEKFMAEDVKVEVAQSADEHAGIGFCIEVNGRKEFFVQGEQKTVKRYFVEGLARAKRTGYRPIKKREDDGDNQYDYMPTTGLRYNFVVVNDTQKGREWLTGVLRQP